MKLKLSNVLCNLDEFKIRYNGLRKPFNTKDHKELVAILNKSGNQLINRKLINLIFEEFFMDFVSPGDYGTEIKYIFDYTKEELNNFETKFDSQPFFPNSKEAKKQVCDSLYKSNLELSKKPKPINLIEKYPSQENDIREKFEAFKYKIAGFNTENVEYDLSIGDIILFKNGYDVEMITEILGFDSEGDCYLLWDCYWSPIRLNERFIELISKKQNKINVEKFIDDLKMKHSFDDLYEIGNFEETNKIIITGATYDYIDETILINYINELGFTADIKINQNPSVHGDFFYWDINIKNVCVL